MRKHLKTFKISLNIVYDSITLCFVFIYFILIPVELTHSAIFVYHFFPNSVKSLALESVDLKAS